MLKRSKTRIVRPTLRHLARVMVQTSISVIAYVAHVWRHRRDLALLARFDDHMLADMGLTRSDLCDAMAESRWRDPTAPLEKRLDERRSSRTMILWLADGILGGRPAAPPNAGLPAATAVLTW
jgi:uncharacterized protein YjiS (DUF1127 family)